MEQEGHAILYAGMLLYMLEVKLPLWSLPYLAFFTCMYMSRAVADRWQPMYGEDTSSYLAQAGAFWNGETDYKKLMGPEGPAFYVAGHIWHFVPLYMLHIATPNASYYIIRLFQVMYAMNCGLATDVACKYFRRVP